MGPQGISFHFCTEWKQASSSSLMAAGSTGGGKNTKKLISTKTIHLSEYLVT